MGGGRGGMKEVQGANLTRNFLFYFFLGGEGGGRGGMEEVQDALGSSSIICDW